MPAQRFYCDESGHTSERHMVIGGISTPEPNIKILRDQLDEWREENKAQHEFKWNKVRKRNVAKYKLFIDVFFLLNSNNKFGFHSIIVDNNAADHAKFNAGDIDLGLNKFYYQLILHKFGRPLGRKNDLHVRLDERKSKYSLNELRDILNNGINLRYQIDSRPFKTVEGVKSHTSELVQFTDVLIGAIGFHRNQRQLLASYNSGKAELAEYIAKEASLSDLGQDTPYRMRSRFTIWNFQLQV